MNASLAAAVNESVIRLFKPARNAVELTKHSKVPRNLALVTSLCMLFAQVLQGKLPYVPPLYTQALILLFWPQHIIEIQSKTMKALPPMEADSIVS
jgi:hypothetical protein